MIFLRFTGTTNERYLKGISIILMFAYLINFSSCYTTRSESVTPDKLSGKDDYTINEIVLKNDTVIKLKGTEATFHKDPDKSKSFLSYTQTDSVFLKDRKQKEYMLHSTLNKIYADSIVSVAITNSEFNTGKTLLIGGGIIFGVLLISLIVYIISPPKLSSGL